MSVTNSSIDTPVAWSDFASDSVDGHRARPSGVMRFDLLKVVGSSPARLANPDGDSLERAANRSSALQIWACVSMAFFIPAPLALLGQLRLLSSNRNYSHR